MTFVLFIFLVILTIFFLLFFAPTMLSEVGEEWKSLVTLFQEKYYICRDKKCVMISSTLKAYAEPRGRLHNKRCVQCDKTINVKSFGLLPVEFCRFVRNEMDYSDDDDVDQLPRCTNVVCGVCALPKAKRQSKQIIFGGMNGL